MSTFSYTDWTVICNGEDDGRPCMEQERTDTLDMMNGTATKVRAVLRRRGWAVNVPDPEWEEAKRDGRRRRGTMLDFCPKHKPQKG